MSLTRRRFLMVMGAAALSTERTLEAEAARRRARRPLFRFLQLNDVHVAYDDRDSYGKAREKFEALIERISSATPDARPDLVLAVGDIANGDVVHKLGPDNAEAAAMLRRVGVPVLPTPGNHEVLQGEGDPALERGYVSAFGADPMTYAVSYGGLLFVMVNNAGGRAGGDAVSDRRNALVADLMDRYPDMPKVVACHIPLVPLREPGPLAKSFGFATWKVMGEGGLLPVIERHRDTVIAVLNGHLHLTGHVEVNGIHHVCVSGTASYPCDYAEYVVYSNRIVVRMLRPPAHLVTPETDIHNRTGVAYTDRDHPTHEEYVCGRQDERAFEIDLVGRKRVRWTSSLLSLKANGWPAPNCETAALTDFRSRVRNRDRRERVVCVPFRAAPRAPVYVTSARGRRLHLAPSGADTWRPEELRAGVPVVLGPEGSAVLTARERTPSGRVEAVAAAPLLAREREEAPL